jgi:uncharacterized protein (DUF1919 family)
MPASTLKTVSAGRTLAPLLRYFVGDANFTVVSNNCWGAHIYQALNVEYQTPFVGLFLPPKSYLALVRRFDSLIRSELSFTNASEVASVNQWRERTGLSYPIGLLDGHVEIHFQHYASQEEARAKWQRRCRRMSSDPARWFFKFDDREGATDDDIREFCNLPLKNKVCFTHRACSSPTIVIPGDAGDAQVRDGVSLAKISRHHFNTLRWISTRPAQIPLPSLL